MYIVIIIGILFLRIIYFFMKFLVVQNKIVFVSRQSDNVSIDFKMIIDRLNKYYPDIKVVVITKKMDKRLKSIIKNVKIIFMQMYHISTSKVCIADGYNIPVSVLKHRKSLKIIQIWHSLGAIKKFGHQTLNTKRKQKIAKLLCMHKNYDYLISGSKEMVKYFSKSFNYSKDMFYPVGLPRIDYLIKYSDENRKLVYNKYPNFKGKKIILYAPTFRENNNYKIDELIKAIDLEKYILIIKLHPNTYYPIKKQKNVYTCHDLSALQILSVTDFVITDYSAISIEASILNKKIYIYAYDLKEYSKYPGLNINLKKYFPNLVFENVEDLIKCLNTNKYDMDLIDSYKNKFIDNKSGNVTDELVKFIVEIGGF